MTDTKKKPTEDKLIKNPVIPFAIEIKGPLRETQIAKLVKALCETVSTFLVDNTNIKKYTRISSERQELNKVKQLSQEVEALKKKLKILEDPDTLIMEDVTNKDIKNIAVKEIPSIIKELSKEEEKDLKEAVDKEFPDKEPE